MIKIDKDHRPQLIIACSPPLAARFVDGKLDRRTTAACLVASVWGAQLGPSVPLECQLRV